MIKEAGPSDFVDCLDEVLEGSGVVVRGAVEPEQAIIMASFVPDLGRRRVYLSPTLSREAALKLSLLDKNRQTIHEIAASRLGKLATLFGNYVMKPDMLRAGMSQVHIDGRGTIISGSLNLNNGAGGCTFYSSRIADVDAPYSQIQRLFTEIDLSLTDMDSCELGVGDMVLISRGTAHGSVSADDRKSITYRVRGLVCGDLQ